MYDDLTKPYEQIQDISSLQLGEIVLDDKMLSNAPVFLNLKALNRHGLIAGATGTGKTKTIQVLCEQLSLEGIPSFVMDIKGDVSGLAMPGEESDTFKKRNESMGLAYNPRGFPVELFTLNEQIEGIPLRATIYDFGALLFSRMLGINDTQSGVLTILFEYAKKNQIPLIDLQDLKALLQFMQSPAGNAEIEAQYGSVSSNSIGIIMRKIIELQAQGGDGFFGQPAFDVEDLLRTDNQGQGIISILRLMDMQEKPQLFSTFMIKLLSDIYRKFPELGDLDKPKLLFFIDEAHLIFNNASKALLDLLETMVKLIRSKGVGLIFCTQTPNDIPEAVLSQLGLKIQHALRAFTAKDRQAMKLVAQNFPVSTYYKTEQLLTALGIGEALVSALDAKGQPTPLVECKVRAPESRMGVLKDNEVSALILRSKLYGLYKKRVQHASAAVKLPQGQVEVEIETKRERNTKADPSMVETLSKNTLVRSVVRDFFKWFLKMMSKK